MLARPWLAALLPLSLLALLACEPSPEGPPIVAPPTSYVANVTYNTTVNVAPGDQAATPAAPPPPAPPAASAPAPPPPPPPSPPPPSPPRAVPPPARLSTGMQVCDDYIARVESCADRMLAAADGRSGPGGAETMEDGIELMRRTYRRTLRTHPEQRASLVDSCSTALTMYNRSLAASPRMCP